MVRVLVEDDVVTVPEPAVGVGVFERCDAEEEAVEAVAAAASAFQAKDVAAATVGRGAPARPGTVGWETRGGPGCWVGDVRDGPGVPLVGARGALRGGGGAAG